MINKANKEILKELSANLFIFLIGALTLLVGILVFYTKMFGVRGGDYTEGLFAQVGGIVLMLLGCYVMLLTIRKIVKELKNRNV
jgi:uncharacterized membrane protein YidH (DUF202 family)